MLAVESEPIWGGENVVIRLVTREWVDIDCGHT